MVCVRGTLPNGCVQHLNPESTWQIGKPAFLNVKQLPWWILCNPLLMMLTSIVLAGSGEGALTLLAETEKKFRRNLEPGGGSLADDEASSAAAEVRNSRCTSLTLYENS